MNIICIHGLAGSGYPYNKLCKTLENIGNKTYVFTYPSCNLTLLEAAVMLDNYITDSKIENVILIGHSAGGRVALLAEHSNIMGIITISTPIQGSYLAHKASFMGFYFGPMLSDIAKPHVYRIHKPLATIRTSYIHNFDGRVWVDEMAHKDSVYTEHITLSYHSGKQIRDDRIIGAIIKALIVFKCKNCF